MIDQLHNLRKLMGLFDIAQESGSQEIRISITDLSLIVSDVNKLLSTMVETKQEQPVSAMQTELDFDAGKF